MTDELADAIRRSALAGRSASPTPHTRTRLLHLGAKSYGRLDTFLLRTGYEQVDVVMGTIPTYP
ncbi:hypothetical protein [Streptomyces halobius]|uniref:Uncharacterized protein n=1 Tax=Streptomyces halobius TaxID=2879846 RepID=A0ABY4MKV7_9ACTN|nr:hypothetical protein [Streptomyces halobius]UQA97060.1 hypothetical protein K9S39_38955 [Streptomyces halobius]